MAFNFKKKNQYFSKIKKTYDQDSKKIVKKIIKNQKKTLDKIIINYKLKFLFIEK